MTVIILIGAWVYSGYRQGDFLRLGTWLLGKKNGFDLGMIAEMGMQSLDLMVSDFSRIRQAQELKGTRWGSGALFRPAVSLSMVHSGGRRILRRLMAARGYCPWRELLPGI